MMRPLAAGLAVFIVGGLLAGWSALSNLRELGRLRPGISMAVTEPRGAASNAQVQSPRPVEHDSADTPTPFEAAAPINAGPPPHPSSPAGRLTILLMGIDQRPDQAAPRGDPGRTDSMLLVSVDFDAHTAVMVSIPRDGFIVIPGHGSDRINAAYTYGELEHTGSGPDLAKRTVSAVLGVPVDRFALVDIHSMERLIDGLGGVCIDVPQRLLDRQYPTDDYRTIKVDIPAGRQLMDGVTAVEYARMRHPDSDYGRQARQQQVLLALHNQVLRLEILPKLPQLIGEAANLVRTDLTPLEIGQLVAFGRSLSAERDILTLPPDPQLTPSYVGPGGASYVYVSPAFRLAVKQLLEHPRVAAERADIIVLNAGAPVGSGSRAASLLGQAGLSVATVDVAPGVAATRIEAGSGARQTALAIARTLGLPPDALVVSGDSREVRLLLGPNTRLPVT